MLRKSVVILTMLLCSMATQVYALGLGSVSVESALNQPLRVRIEILQLGDTRLQDVNIQMASQDDFQRFNIERVGFLSNVRFSVEATTQGNFDTLISSQIVREPYLSFILETRWPSGRLLSEHTVLLDLPVFDDQQATASVRTPISPVLQRPDAATQPDQPFVEPAVPAVTPPTQSVQPILEPEIIEAPALQPQDLTSEPEEVISEPIPESEALIEDPEILPTDLAQEETAEPAAEAVVEEQAVAVVEETVEEQAVAVEPEPEAEPEPVQVEVAEEEEVEPEPAPVEVAEEIAADEVPETPDLAEEIETSATDTLSDIALRVRPSNSVTIQQTMLALQELNPDAFVVGNINQLRSGQVMRVPTLAEVEAIDPQEAINEVTRQNQQVAEVDVEPLAAPTDATPDQDDQPQGQLSVVSGDADAIDASAGISELDDEENAELDRRVAELENQLALRQEEADRARIEREDLDSRMAELEEQIAEAQEIIRLQDLQLAQLQESLATAAGEAEAQAEAEAEAEQAALLAAAEVETAIPVSSSSTLFDDVMRILTGNTLMMGFGIALVILLLVVLLLRRNKSTKSEDESLDELAEQEFAAESEETEVTADEGAVVLKDTDPDSELDSELDELIGGLDEDADPAPADMGELNASVDALIEDDQLEDAVRLLESAVDDGPDNHDLRLRLLEVVTLQGDLALFDSHAEILATQLSPVIDRQVKNLREQFGDVGPAEAVTDAAPEQEAPTQDESELDVVEMEADVDVEPEPEAEAEVEPAKDDAEQAGKSGEAASFLDDLGINLDSFDDDSFEFSYEEDKPEEEPVKKEETSAQESTAEAEDTPMSLEFDEPTDVALTFDLGGGDEEAAQDESVEESETASQDESDVEEEPEESEQEPEDAEDSAAAADESADVDFDVDDQQVVSVEGGAKDTEDLDIDALDFDFDKSEIKQEVEVEVESAEAGVESVDFEMDDNKGDMSTDTEPVAEQEPEDDIEAISMDVADGEQPDSSDEKTEIDLDEVAIETETDDEVATDLEDDDSDIDIDLDEYDVEEDPAESTSAATEEESAGSDDAEAEEEGDDYYDLDAEVADAESTKEAAIDKEEEFDLGAEIDQDADDEATEESDVEEQQDEEEDLEDLGFLSDEDEVEIESVGEIEEVEMLSDDETATKLELAYAYQKMGDTEGAEEILQEVIKEGSKEQVEEAKNLLASLSNLSD